MLSRKGFGATSEVIVVMGSIIIAVLLLLLVPKYLTDLMELMTLASAQAVSKDLAGLACISMAAPSNVSINYHGESEMIYYELSERSGVTTVNMVNKKGDVLETVSEPSCAIRTYIALSGRSQDFVVEKVRALIGTQYFNEVHIGTG